MIILLTLQIMKIFESKYIISTNDYYLYNFVEGKNFNK